MSQLNVDALRHSSGSGSGIDLQSSGNIAFDTNTLYVDSTNNRIGINTAAPTTTFDITGTDGVNLNTAPLLESVNVVSGSSNSNTTIDAMTAAVHLYTSANTGNWTPNIRGNASTTLNSIMGTGQICVITLISTNGGSSGYVGSSVNIDGSSKSVQWLNGSAPADRGGTSGFDMVQYSIIKTAANTYTIFGTVTYLD